MAHVRRTSIPRIAIFFSCTFPRVVSLLLLMYLSLLSFSLLLTFPLCNPSVGIVFTNTSERMGICQGCLEKRCDSVELWDCYMSAEFPAYERSSLPCSLSKQTPKKLNAHIFIFVLLQSSRAARQHMSHQHQKTLRVFFSPAVKCKAI